MIAIGIDPSVTHTGVVVINHFGVLEALPHKTKPVPDWRAQAHRLEEIAGWVNGKLSAWQKSNPNLAIFMEDFATGSAHANTLLPQAMLGGFLRLHLSFYEQAYLVSPTAVKKFATGSGNASKVEVATQLTKRFRVDFKGDDNLYDAFAMARMALCYLGDNWLLTQEQIKVVQKVVGK